jgi:hypothetical protein
MRRILLLIPAILFLCTCIAVPADSQKVFANVNNGEAVASQRARFTPVADRSTVPGPNRGADNDAVALANLKALAGQGDAEAQYRLGLRYFRGQGVPQNYVAACMWLYLANAAATGDFGAETMRARFEVYSMMEPEQVAEARRMAIAWQKKRTPDMPTPGKEDLLDTFAKVDACSDAGHIARDSVEKDIVPRVQYYARLFFSERDIDDMGASIPDRKKKAVTAFGWGCESAFNALAALPLPKAPGNTAR